jgi:1-deoxy-D-xylulose-5-phosphate synthase
LQKIPVIFCLDRAGIVGEDGPTHHGIFDLAYLNCIPNLIIFAPRNEIELRNIMFTAQQGLDFPIFIRYPRGRGKILDWQKSFSKIEIGKATVLKEGSDTVVLTIGTIEDNVLEAIGTFPAVQQQKIGLVAMRFLKPMDEVILHQIFKKYKTIITVEDGTIIGGLGTSVAAFATSKGYKNKIEMIGIPDVFPEQGTISELQEIAGISSEKIKQSLQKYL